MGRWCRECCHASAIPARGVPDVHCFRNASDAAFRSICVNKYNSHLGVGACPRAVVRAAVGRASAASLRRRLRCFLGASIASGDCRISWPRCRGPPSAPGRRVRPPVGAATSSSTSAALSGRLSTAPAQNSASPPETPPRPGGAPRQHNQAARIDRRRQLRTSGPFCPPVRGARPHPRLLPAHRAG